MYMIHGNGDKDIPFTAVEESVVRDGDLLLAHGTGEGISRVLYSLGLSKKRMRRV